MLVFMLFSSCGPNPTPVLWGFLPSLVWPIWSLRAFKDGSDEKLLSPHESIHQNTTETIWKDKQLSSEPTGERSDKLRLWVQWKPECCFVAVTLGKRWFIHEQHIRKYSVLCKSKQRFNVREPVQRCEQQPLIFIFLLQHNPKTAAALCNAGALHNPIKPSYGDNAFAFSSERKIKLRLRSV